MRLYLIMRLIEITMGSTNGNGWCTISKVQIYDEYHHRKKYIY